LKPRVEKKRLTANSCRTNCTPQSIILTRNRERGQVRSWRNDYRKLTERNQKSASTLEHKREKKKKS